MSAASILSWKSRLSHVFQASLVLWATWIAGIVWFYLYGRTGNVIGFALIDFCAAFIFWRMSRTHWFPAPLFYLHAFLLFYYLWSTAFDLSGLWVTLFINRVFELCLIYVAGAAMIKIIRTRADRYRKKQPF